MGGMQRWFALVVGVALGGAFAAQDVVALQAYEPEPTRPVRPPADPTPDPSPAPVPSSGAAVGRTMGMPGVSAAGEALYEIPLTLPPGTNGLRPRLSLRYGHRSREGSLGTGWSLGGLSVITRCERTLAQDGAFAPVELGANDRFCLDGVRMVVVNGQPYGGAGAEFRTELEPFDRIRASGVAGAGPERFVVETADGRILEYGGTADARIDWAGRYATPRAWALSRISDRAGNVADYQYAEDASTGGYRVTRITYNANPGAGIPASHAITFSYGQRPSGDAELKFLAGASIRQSRRLTDIDVLYGADVIRRYELSYEPAPSTGRSRLVAVRECGRGGQNCLQPTSLSWQDGISGLAAEQAYPLVLGTARVDESKRWWASDINGDGRADLVWAGGTSTVPTLHYRLATATGTLAADVDTGIAAPRGAGVPFDYDGDGRSDALLRTGNGGWAVVLGSPAGLDRQVDTGISANVIDFRGADLDGNGLGDLVYSTTFGNYSNALVVRVHYNHPGTGLATTPVAVYDQPTYGGYAIAEGGQFLGAPGQVIDLDGDGREDLLMSEKYSVARISADARMSEPLEGRASDAVPADVNGDACTDLVYPNHDGRWHVRMSGCMVHGPYGVDIAGPATSGLRLEAQSIDWDGDLRDDVVFSNGTDQWLLLRSVGDGQLVATSTGLAASAVDNVSVADVDGDGLPDLLSRGGSRLSIRRHAGRAPDLLREVTDGFGVMARYAYAPLSDPAVYSRGNDVAYPLRGIQDGRPVVASLSVSDGTGRDQLTRRVYQYTGLRSDPTGRGDVGFASRVVRDESNGGLTHTFDHLQVFPYTGRVAEETVARLDGAVVIRRHNDWRVASVGSGQAVRQHPYVSLARESRFEPGQPAYMTRTLRVDAVDTLSGLVTDHTVTTVEGDGGPNPGASHSERFHHASVLNDVSNWCIGRPVTSERSASHTLRDGESLTERTTLDWDEIACRPIALHIEPGDPQWQVTVSLEYDSFGNVSRESVTGADMAARTTTLAWDASGRFPRRITNALGQSVTGGWDPATGMLLTVRDPNGSVASWQYDDFGWLRIETMPDGSQVRWSRTGCGSDCDARARYRLQRDRIGADGLAGVSETSEFDRFDRRIRALRPLPGSGRSVRSADFDAAGRLVREHLPAWEGAGSGGDREYDYDWLGRRVRESLYGPGGVLYRATGYDHDGLTTTTTDPRGNATTRTRAAWGGVIEARDATGRTIHYSYDAFGRLRRVADGAGQTLSSVTYNRRGMKLAQQDADLGSWTFERDALGQLLSQRDAKGQVSRFDYDLLGRPVRRSEVEGITTLTWGTSAAAHNIGRLASIAGPGYAESYGYDSTSRLASRQIQSDATYRYDYGYDSLSRLSVLVYPASSAGFRLRLGYDYVQGELVRIRDASAGGMQLWQLNATDAAGKVLDEVLGGRVQVVSGYDPVTSALEYRQARDGGNPIQDLSYRWGPAGNLLERRDATNGVFESFSYDAVQRLTSADLGGSARLEVGYDVDGRVSWRSDVCPANEPCFSYDASHRHAVTKAGANRFAYDANGDMTLRNGTAVSWYSYRFPKSIGSGANQSQFWYDPARNRWRQAASNDGAWATTVYVGGMLEKAIAAGKTTWRHYILAPTGPVAVHLRHGDGTPPRTLLLTHDHLGSIDRAVDAATGELAFEIGYDAFGRRRAVGADSAPGRTQLAAIGYVTRAGFAGHEHLDNLGLVHMGGRVYDPTLGRFLSPDPITHRPLDARDLDRYAYGWNSPLNVTDPSGLQELYCRDGHCPTVTVTGLREWPSWTLPYLHLSDLTGQVASAAQRDPCGQDGSAAACRGDRSQQVGPGPAATVADYLQGLAARLANIAMDSVPAFWLFDSSAGFHWFPIPESEAGADGARLGDVGYLLGGVTGALRPAVAGTARRLVASRGGLVRRFELATDRVFYRAYSGDATVGSWLTPVRPRSQTWAQEALSLPPWNGATHVQEVLVPRGTLMERSRASSVPEWGRLRGGAEQFKLLETIPESNFGPGSPLP